MEIDNDSNKSRNIEAHLKGPGVRIRNERLFLDEDTADVRFVFRDHDGKTTERIPAHKAILAVASHVFKAMLYGPLQEAGDVEIVDTSPETFKEFLKFCYIDDVIIRLENVAELMHLADKYLFGELMNCCEEFLYYHLSIEHVCTAYELAIKYSLVELQEQLECKIGNGATNVFASATFLTCPQNILKRILEIDSLLCLPNEVFYACMAWAENACLLKGLDAEIMANRKNQLGECFYHIPFYMMRSEHVLQIVDDENFKNLFDSDELCDLIRIVTSNNSTSLKKLCPKQYGSVFFNCQWGNSSLTIAAGSKVWVSKVLKLGFSISEGTSAYHICGIKKATIFQDTSDDVKLLTGIMTVAQILNGSEDKVLLKQKIQIRCRKPNQFNEQTIFFTKPVLCEREKKFAIRFEFDASWMERTFFTDDFVSKKLSFWWR